MRSSYRFFLWGRSVAALLFWKIWYIISLDLPVFENIDKRTVLMKKILVLIWIGALLLGLLIYGMVDTPRPETQAPTASEDGGTEDVPTTPVAKIQLRIRAPREWDAVISDYAAVSGVQLQRVDDLSGDPELIRVDSALEVAQWSDRCADLSATAAYAQLVSWDLAVKVDGNVCAIPLQMEGHGLVCDTKLLASAYSLSDIRDFETLRDSVAYHRCRDDRLRTDYGGETGSLGGVFAGG